MLARTVFKSSLIAFACSVAVAAHAVAEERKQINVPAGDLIVALKVLAQQSGADLVYRSEQLEGLRTQGAVGALSNEEAARKLLEGTNLTLRIDSSGAMLISLPREGEARPNPAPATTQSTAPVTSQSTNDSSQGEGLEEIIVTAQRREQSLQETPLAVSALTADAIASRQLTNVTEVDRYVPNLQWGPATSGAASTSSLSIRGIGQIDFATTTDPGVAMHVDGVYLGRVTGSALDLADIDRIEILRGPQGTLFGRNTAGGAVNIITARPSGQFGGKIEATGGMYTDDGQGKFQGKLSLDAPVTDTLAAKLNVLGKFSDGWGRNASPGRGEGMPKDDDVAVRLSLLWQPAENLDLYFTADHSERNGTVIPHATLTGPEALSEDDPLAGRVNAITQDDLEVTGFSLTADLTWNDVTFRSISGYREQHASSGQDFDGSDFAVAEQFSVIEHDQFTQELHAFGAAFNKRLDWLLGAFYFEEDARFDSVLNVFGTPGSTNDVRNGTESQAAFANATLHLTDALRLTGGLRYTEETKDIEFIEALFGPFPAVPPGSRESANFTDLSHKIALEYQVAADVMAYVSWSQGFRSGGFNGRPSSLADLVPYDEEINDSYELGIKSDWLNRRLRLNLAAFFSEYQNIQLATVVEAPGGGIGTATDNAGDADIKGVELEFDFAASERLKIYGALGLQNVMDVIEPRPGFLLDPSRVGNSLPQASEVNSALGFSYLLPWSRYESRFSADWTSRSSYYHQIDNYESVKEDGYHLLNASFNLKPSEHWSFTLYGKNLTGEVYRVYGVGLAALDIATVWYGPTREVGATVSWSF